MERLRDHAAERGLSLSAYVREVLAADAQRVSLPEMMARLSQREAVDLTDEEIIDAIHEGRR